MYYNDKHKMKSIILLISMELYNFSIITIEIDNYTVYYYEYTYTHVKAMKLTSMNFAKKKALLIDVNC